MTATEKELTQLLRRIYEAKTIGDARRLVVESLGDAILSSPTHERAAPAPEPATKDIVALSEKYPDYHLLLNAFAAHLSQRPSGVKTS